MADGVWTAEEFAQETAEGKVLVEFWATWCGPCKMFAPVLEQIRKELEGECKVLKLDVDENPDVSKQFNVRNLPAMFLMQDGEIMEQYTGVQDKGKLLAAIRGL